MENQLWGIVLAAGEGSRLRTLTVNEEGFAVPKQFCSFRGSQSMLREALSRAERLIPRERILVVVARQHRRWWENELADWPAENILEQPENRGTAAGVLFPFIEILRRDPFAQILVLPSDHYVEEEEVLQSTLEKALPASHAVFERVILLGITPEGPDTEYGWILPDDGERSLAHPVDSFWEKPDSATAERLFYQGALWNSFMFLTAAPTLLRLFKEILPDLLRPFLSRLLDADPQWDFETLAALYESLPTLDFSQHLLEKASRRLAVTAVPHCGWSDLGTPERILRCLSRAQEKYPKQFPPREAGRVLALPREEKLAENCQQEGVQLQPNPSF